MTTTEQAATEQAGGGAMPPLHLDSLVIEGFRGIDLLEIPRLGRVTLLAGKNSVGKSTVLDAVRVYAARGSAAALSDILRSREEVVTNLDEDGDPVLATNIAALFHGRVPMEGVRVSIGSEGEGTLTIAPTLAAEIDSYDLARLPPRVLDGVLYALGATYKGHSWVIPWLFSNEGVSVQPTIIRPRPSLADRGLPTRRFIGMEEPLRSIKCEMLGPGLPNNVTLARLWDNAVNEGGEQFAKEPLGMIFGDTVESVYMVGDARERVAGRRAVVKIASYGSRMAPLKSLGDGALRLYSVALALANSKNGFLLIDEAENGLHYSIQRDFWRMVLQAAQANNVQVLATTHSADCIRGFAEASNENPNLDGVYFRMERDAEGVYRVDYSKNNLLNAARNRTEVR